MKKHHNFASFHKFLWFQVEVAGRCRSGWCCRGSRHGFGPSTWHLGPGAANSATHPPGECLAKSGATSGDLVDVLNYRYWRHTSESFMMILAVQFLRNIGLIWCAEADLVRRRRRERERERERDVQSVIALLCEPDLEWVMILRRFESLQNDTHRTEVREKWLPCVSVILWDWSGLAMSLL